MLLQPLAFRFAGVPNQRHTFRHTRPPPRLFLAITGPIASVERQAFVHVLTNLARTAPFRAASYTADVQDFALAPVKQRTPHFGVCSAARQPYPLPKHPLYGTRK